jgi:hypothetical protein
VDAPKQEEPYEISLHVGGSKGMKLSHQSRKGTNAEIDQKSILKSPRHAKTTRNLEAEAEYPTHANQDALRIPVKKQRFLEKVNIKASASRSTMLYKVNQDQIARAADASGQI